VHVFNEFAQRVPDGVYLRKITQSGQRINLTGYAQANARVSVLMQNLEASPILEKPELVEIRAEIVGGRRLSHFNMYVKIKREVKEDLGAANKRKKP
jgi:type IV pilus assembly protein PilN